MVSNGYVAGTWSDCAIMKAHDAWMPSVDASESDAAEVLPQKCLRQKCLR